MQFWRNIFLSSSFNELFLSEKAGNLLGKYRKRILLRNFWNEQNGAGDKALRICAVRLAEQTFDAISHDAFSVFFPDADRHLPRLIGKIDDGKMFGVRALSAFEDLGKFLFLLDPKVFHVRGDLRGDVLSALVSPSFQGVSSALRLHSLAEPVHLASLALLGLIRSLHNKLLVFRGALFWEFSAPRRADFSVIFLPVF